MKSTRLSDTDEAKMDVVEFLRGCASHAVDPDSHAAMSSVADWAESIRRLHLEDLDRIAELEAANKRLTGLVMLQGGSAPSEEQRHAIVAEYLEVSDE